MLEVNRLTKCYGDYAAVKDLSFTVSGGEIVGLLGPNGAGKTTTIRCITSILEPTEGRVTLDGHDIVTDTEAAKRTLAYVPEVPNPYELLTVFEHLRFIAAAYHMELDKAYAETVLRRLDLWDKRFELAAALSKGMKQKLSCACAFVHRPRIYCFDEPLIGIDPKGSRELKDMLLERRSAGDAVLISTHLLDTAERLCDRVIILNKGTMVAEGSVSNLLARNGADATLEDIFLQLTDGEG
ncbi:MAG: ABC transporter ATP-binding protein [Capsulimonadaceae bacterium]